MRPILRLAALAMFASLALGCAFGPIYHDPKPGGENVIGDQKAIMADHPCGQLAIDLNGGVDNAPGWVKGTAPAGMDPNASCHAKYNPPFYCAGSDCKTLVYKALPKDPDDRGKQWVFVADVLSGDALACADQCNKFAWSLDRAALECAWKPVSGAAGARRFIFSAQVTTDPKTSTAMCFYVKPDPAHPGKIALGQLGVAQSPTN